MQQIIGHYICRGLPRNRTPFKGQEITILINSSKALNYVRNVVANSSISSNNKIYICQALLRMQGGCWPTQLGRSSKITDLVIGLFDRGVLRQPLDFEHFSHSQKWGKSGLVHIHLSTVNKFNYRYEIIKLGIFEEENWISRMLLQAKTHISAAQIMI